MIDISNKTEPDVPSRIKQHVFELEKNISSNGGSISSGPFFTHLVLIGELENNDNIDSEFFKNLGWDLDDDNISRLISETWVLDCVKCHYYLDPEWYYIKKNEFQSGSTESESNSIGEFIATIRRNSKKSSEFITSSSEESQNFRRPLKSSSQSKTGSFNQFSTSSNVTGGDRLMLIQEVAATEYSFLKDLHYFDEIYAKKISMTFEHNTSGYDSRSMLTPAEFKTVFQPVRELLKLHTTMYDHLTNLIENYDEITSCLVVLADHKIEPCHFGLRATQRLSTYIILLEKLVKRTPQSHIDHPKLLKAHSALKEILKNVNENIRTYENELTHMEMVYFLDKCPDPLRSAKFKLHLHIECALLGSFSAKIVTKAMHLYLFESCLEIARHKSHSTTLFSPKTHSYSNNQKSNLMPGKNTSSFEVKSIKKLKHIDLVTLDSINQVIYIDDEKAGKLLAISYATKSDRLNTLKTVYDSDNTASLKKTTCDSFLQTPRNVLLTFKCWKQNSTLEYAEKIHQMVSNYIDALDEPEESNYCGFLVKSNDYEECLKTWAPTSLKDNVSNSCEIDGTSGSLDSNGRKIESFNRRLSMKISN
ncbi:MAG: Protein T2, partial [Paramarteilia canceri]